MPDHDPDSAFGTAALDAPVSRADLERAIRSLNLADLDLRDMMLALAARVVALTDELTRRLDPAPPTSAVEAASVDAASVEAAVDAAVPATLAAIKAADAQGAPHVALDLGGSKYHAASPAIPCDELIPLCGGRCCTFSFSLSTEDLDEGVIRWDYGQPYLIRQRASDGFCVHNAPDTHDCTVHAHRPRVCRAYDCRDDKRVWVDYATRVPAPMPPPYERPAAFDLVERARARAEAIHRESLAIRNTVADPAPRRGPRP